MKDPKAEILKLAEKKFYLGFFGLGLTLLFAGILPDPNNVTWIGPEEFLLIARLGALFVIISAFLWSKSNDYQIAAQNIEVELKKIDLDNEIKTKQLELEKKQIVLQEQLARKPNLNP